MEEARVIRQTNRQQLTLSEIETYNDSLTRIPATAKTLIFHFKCFLLVLAPYLLNSNIKTVARLL